MNELCTLVASVRMLDLQANGYGIYAAFESMNTSSTEVVTETREFTSDGALSKRWASSNPGSLSATLQDWALGADRETNLLSEDGQVINPENMYSYRFPMDTQYFKKFNKAYQLVLSAEDQLGNKTESIKVLTMVKDTTPPVSRAHRVWSL